MELKYTLGNRNLPLWGAEFPSLPRAGVGASSRHLCAGRGRWRAGGEGSAELLRGCDPPGLLLWGQDVSAGLSTKFRQFL